MGTPENDAARFRSKLYRGYNTDCVYFQGTPRPDGYVQFGVGSLRDGTRRNVLAHRYAYELANGPIPPGMTVDHECHNRSECAGGVDCPHRSCARADHLIARLIRDNVLAGRTPPAANAAKTHCPQGHPYDEVNTRHRGNTRACRACDREHARAYRAANPDKVREANRRAEARRKPRVR